MSISSGAIADRWLEAVETMGGNTAPWSFPNMNFRAWELSTMTPRTDDVLEPEAAGAIAWILYNAYLTTGDDKYRIGAEWCIEFLSSLGSNPSYEIQLPYGVLAAARMNAELGTSYNIEKLINWCFNNYYYRNWGTIVGTWGGYDVNGLIGETYNNNNNGYAFLMNTLEQAGALVPLVRYDERFARAIGKWMLNAANSARLFYTNYLPDDYQDSEGWSHQYDPNSYIGHEALRQLKDARSPFATGDAISGGWGLTNLALYGSSHVGILGGIIETTNVEQILKLDLRRTDYFNASGYPSYLFFNPYAEIKTIDFNAGSGVSDIYDLISKTFIKSGVSGTTSLDIPPDAPLIAVVVPSGGAVTYDLNKMLVNGIVADYNSGQASNFPPRIKSLSAEASEIIVGDSINIFCTAEDKNKDVLTYSWSTSGGTITGTFSSVKFTAPDNPGNIKVVCTVNDGKGGITSDTITINIVEKINNSPQINYLKAVPRKIDINSSTEITCSAFDTDGDNLAYVWSSSAGSFSGSDSIVTWNSPSVPGNYAVYCAVNDETSEVKDSVVVVVRDFSITQTGSLVLYLPFNGNAVDESGNNHSVSVYQALPVSDRFNVPNSAFFFDGADDNMLVANAPDLNFQTSISVNFWIKINSFFPREAYPLSHGNWENRWKISLTNQKIRWTIKTNSGITDLDSETELTTDSLYNISALYNGSDVEIYINGELDALKTWQGSINQTTYAIVLGQSLPGNYNYGFRGVLDDVRIFNYAVSMDQIKSFYDLPSGTEENNEPIPQTFFLAQNYPNPFNPETVIKYFIPASERVSLVLYDVLGNEITTLVNEIIAPGFHQVRLNTGRLNLSSGVYFYKFVTDTYSETKKMILMR